MVVVQPGGASGYPGRSLSVRPQVSPACRYSTRVTSSSMPPEAEVVPVKVGRFWYLCGMFVLLVW